MRVGKRMDIRLDYDAPGNGNKLAVELRYLSDDFRVFLHQQRAFDGVVGRNESSKHCSGCVY